MNNDINIFVSCHKETYVINNPYIVPIQVGSELADIHFEGMLQDNVGDNISAKNKEYCELTAQYWAWKNIDCRYYGFFHYRRYFSFDEIYQVSDNGGILEKKRVKPYYELDSIHEDLTKHRLDPERMKQIINQYDLITVARERIDTTVYRQFCQYHSHEMIDQILKITVDLYPEYAEDIEEYMQSKNIYYMNMYIMKKELFQEYMKWLFSILTKYERYEMDHYGIISDPRAMGYLSERLFGVFYTHKRKQGVKCAELSYIKFYNTEIDEGAISQNYIRTFQLKPTKKQLKIDMRKLNRLFPAGSKRRILLRKIFLR